MLMRRFRLLAGLLVGLFSAAACSATEQPAKPDTSEAVDQARSATDAFARELKSTLLAALESGGPAHALGACRVSAEPVAKSHSIDGIAVGRVSLKPRSASNVPSPAERSVLEAWESKISDGLVDELAKAEHIEIVEENGIARLHYMRPIFVGELCLTCHGPSAHLADDVVAALADGYPADQATGYSVGDLRGAFSTWVALE